MRVRNRPARIQDAASGYTNKPTKDIDGRRETGTACHPDPEARDLLFRIEINITARDDTSILPLRAET
jgi:hypothetical protein